MERQALLFPKPPDDPALPQYAVNDVTDQGGFNFGPMEKPMGVVIHHTGGGGTPEGIMNTFRQRGLATQYIMDREGNIHQSLPDGMRGQHIRPSQINGLTNANTLGIEIIAKDDSDVTEKQRDAAARWLTEVGAKYNFPAANVFGHGEINRHKQATEGSTVVNNWRAANRIATPDLGPPASGGDLPMEQRTLMAYAGRDARPKPQPSPASQYDPIFEEASKETGIPVAVLKAQAQQESGFNPRAIGRAGEVGLLQIKPTTAAQPGYGVPPVDPAKLSDPAENIRFGARYLAARAREAGVQNWNDPSQVAKGLTAYNGGGDPNYAQNVFKYLKAPGQQGGGVQVASAAQPAPQRRGRNPTVQAAAERGGVPLADRPLMGGNIVEQGPSAMPRQAAPDVSNQDNAGIRDLLLYEAGMAPQQQGGYTIPGGGQAQAPSLMQRLMGGGGQGGGGQPQQSGGSVEDLMPFSRPRLLGMFGAGARENEQAAQEHQGRVFAAKQLVAQGMSPQDAVAALNSPGIGQQLALSGIAQQRARQQEAQFAARIDGAGTQPGGGAAGPGPSPIAAGAPVAQPSQTNSPPQPQPSSAPQAAPVQASAAPKILTPNATVNDAFAKRAAAVQEYETLAREAINAPTDRAKDGLKSRLEGIKQRIDQQDKTIDRFATGPIKEYTLAMMQRADRGQPPVPFEQWDPEGEKKAARGAPTEEVSGLRKEIQGLPSYKNITQAAPVYNSMLEAAGRNTRSADVNLIYGMAKIMDPTSVVRESEMTVAQAIATLPDRLQQGARSLLNSEGRLSDDVRKGIMTEAFSRMNSYKGLFDQDTKQFEGIVGRRGINREDVIPDFGTFKPYAAAEKAQGGAGGATPQYKTGATATGRDGTKMRFDGSAWVPFQ